MLALRRASPCFAKVKGDYQLTASVFPFNRQHLFIVLSAVKKAEDGHSQRTVIYAIGDQRAPPAVDNAQAGADVFSRHTSLRKERQTLAR